MAAIDRRHGKNGRVMMDPTGGATAVVVVSMNKWDIDLSTDKSKATCFGDANQVYRTGLPDIKGSYSGCYDSSAAGLSIFGVIFGDVAPFLKLYPDIELDPDTFFGGHALLDGKLSVDVDGIIATSGSWVAADSWTLPEVSA